MTHLFHSQNKLTSLPVQIGELKCLSSLNLSNNSISALPAQLTHCSALTILDLSHNQLETLPNNIGITHMYDS